MRTRARATSYATRLPRRYQLKSRCPVPMATTSSALCRSRPAGAGAQVGAAGVGWAGPRCAARRLPAAPGARERSQDAVAGICTCLRPPSQSSMSTVPLSPLTMTPHSETAQQGGTAAGWVRPAGPTSRGERGSRRRGGAPMCGCRSCCRRRASFRKASQVARERPDVHLFGCKVREAGGQEAGCEGRVLRGMPPPGMPLRPPRRACRRHPEGPAITHLPPPRR